MTLGERIKDYRQEKGMSQREFATKCGLSNGTISIIEKGVNPSTGKPLTPQLPQLQRIASSMNMSVHDLCTEVDDMKVYLSYENANNAPERGQNAMPEWLNADPQMHFKKTISYVPRIEYSTDLEDLNKRILSISIEKREKIVAALKNMVDIAEDDEK